MSILSIPSPLSSTVSLSFWGSGPKMWHEWHCKIAIKWLMSIYSLTTAIINMQQQVASCSVLTCLDRLSLVWVCWACWVCCASVRPCCPAALLSLVWGWVLRVCNSVEQEVLDELSSTEAFKMEKRIHLQIDSGSTVLKQKRYTINIYRSDVAGIVTLLSGAVPPHLNYTVSNRGNKRKSTVTVIVSTCSSSGLSGIIALLLSCLSRSERGTSWARCRVGAAGSWGGATASWLTRCHWFWCCLCPLQGIFLHSMESVRLGLAGDNVRPMWCTRARILAELILWLSIKAYNRSKYSK